VLRMLRLGAERVGGMGYWSGWGLGAGALYGVLSRRVFGRRWREEIGCMIRYLT